jgi:hypothetical protein
VARISVYDHIFVRSRFLDESADGGPWGDYAPTFCMGHHIVPFPSMATGILGVGPTEAKEFTS